MNKPNDSTKRIKKSFRDSQNLESTSRVKKVRDYRLEMTPLLPEKFQQIPLSPPTSSIKPLPRVEIITSTASLEQLYCSNNPNDPLNILEKAKGLHRRTIQSVKAKERLFAARELRRLAHEMQQWTISYFHQNINILGNDPIPLHQLLEKREERHFQIDRIIKYLST